MSNLSFATEGKESRAPASAQAPTPFLLPLLLLPPPFFGCGLGSERHKEREKQREREREKKMVAVGRGGGGRPLEDRRLRLRQPPLLPLSPGGLAHKKWLAVEVGGGSRLSSLPPSSVCIWYGFRGRR